MSEVQVERKRTFHRTIVKTNASSLSKEQMERLRKQIHSAIYLDHAIDKLADNISRALILGYLDPREE